MADLFNEIEQESLSGVLVALEQGADCNRAKRGVTPLQAVVTRGAADELILVLLSHGAEIDRANRFEVTPLMLAATMGYPGIVRLLLKQGATVDAQDKGGSTALMKAVMNDYFSLQELIHAGADLHHQNQIGLTPLDFAYNSQQWSSAFFLCQAGARVDRAKFSTQRHANAATYWVLHSAPALHAVMVGDHALLKTQLEQGTPTGTRRGDDSKEPLLVTASQFGHADLVRLLLEFGADVGIQAAGGRTAMKVAKNQQIVEILQKYGT